MTATKATTTDKAYDYVKRRAPHFREQHRCNDAGCEFCAGWTWGAHAGYMAGYRAAKGKKK